MIIFCDICERTDELFDEAAMTAAGWTVAEDELDTTERHGLCAECGEQHD